MNITTHTITRRSLRSEWLLARLLTVFVASCILFSSVSITNAGVASAAEASEGSVTYTDSKTGEVVEVPANAGEIWQKAVAAFVELVDPSVDPSDPAAVVARAARTITDGAANGHELLTTQSRRSPSPS